MKNKTFVDIADEFGKMFVQNLLEGLHTTFGITRKFLIIACVFTLIATGIFVTYWHFNEYQYGNGIGSILVTLNFSCFCFWGWYLRSSKDRLLLGMLSGLRVVMLYSSPILFITSGLAIAMTGNPTLVPHFLMVNVETLMSATVMYLLIIKDPPKRKSWLKQKAEELRDNMTPKRIPVPA